MTRQAKIEKKCLYCEAVFSVSRCFESRKYCSLICSLIYRQPKLKTFTCKFCGKENTYKSSRIQKYCNNICRLEDFSNRHTRDVTGQKFNNFTAIRRIGTIRKYGQTKSIWVWRCDCGNEKEIPLVDVTSGNTKSCGCLFKSMQRRKDITGQRFGYLTVVRSVYVTGQKGKQKLFWELICDCGKTTTANTSSLRSGGTKTCGCRISCKGENAYNWRGGRKTDSSGYIYIYSPEHPAVQHKQNNRRYVAEHRLVMEKKIGRYLSSKEEVHHKNAIRDDNRPENLELWLRSKQPRGARVSDLLEFAREIIAQYGDLDLKG